MMRIIKNKNLEEKINKQIANELEKYFKDTTILKEHFNSMADEPAKFEIKIGKKNFFKSVEIDIKEVILKELKNSNIPEIEKIANLKVEEVLKKIEKISEEKSRYQSYETIEALPFEFLIKHYNDNNIEEKITDKHLRIYSDIKKEVFNENLDKIFEKQDNGKIYLNDIKNIVDSKEIFENRLIYYKYYENYGTVLDEKIVGIEIDLKKFQEIKEFDWFNNFEGKIVKEILVPDFEKDISDFINKVKEKIKKDNDKKEYINIDELREILINKEVENYLFIKENETKEELKNSLLSYSIGKSLETFGANNKIDFYFSTVKILGNEYDNIFIGKIEKVKFVEKNAEEFGLTLENDKIKEFDDYRCNYYKELENLADNVFFKEIKNEISNKLDEMETFTRDKVAELHNEYYNKKSNKHTIEKYNDIVNEIVKNREKDLYNNELTDILKEYNLTISINKESEIIKKIENHSNDKKVIEIEEKETIKEKEVDL